MPAELPVVTMNIQRQWFAAILAKPRRKRIEYRDMSDYWRTRLRGLGTKRFKLRILNGMRPPVPEATILVERLVRDYRNQEFQLHLGRILNVQNWDRKRECPLFDKNDA
jgi:hypothetical protein